MRRFLLLLLALALPGLASGADCTSTKPATNGSTCTDPTYGATVTRASKWSVDAADATFLNNDYSKTQSFNADSTLYWLRASNGYLHMFNGTTFTHIRKMTGPTDSSEPQWHPTNPDKLWYTLAYGYGLKLYEYTASTDATVEVVNFTARLTAIWPSATYYNTGAEGSPSSDGRYWSWIVKNASFAQLGFFVWDKQTDTILASKSFTGGGADSVSMTPSGNYVVIAFYDGNTIDGVAGKERAYTRDLTDWTWTGCTTGHYDLPVGKNGHDYIVEIDWTNAGDSNCSPQNGYIYMRDIDAGWVSESYATARTDLAPTYYGTGGSEGSIHISGKAFNRPGYVLVGTAGCTDWDPGTPDCPGTLTDKVFLLPLEASPAIQYLTVNHIESPEGHYNLENFASINRAGTKAIFGSNWEIAGEDIDAYIVDIPTTLAITTTTLPNGTVGVAYSQQVAVTGGTLPYTLCDESVGSLPAGSPAFTSTANALGCLIAGTPTETGTTNFTERVTDTDTNTDPQALSITISAALQIDDTTLPDGTVGSGYATCLTASGGTPPYAYSLNAGSNPIPTGLTLTSAGCFTGTIEQTGVHTPTFKVTDDVAATATRQITWTVNSGVTLSMISPTISPLDTTVLVRFGAVGLPYEADCQATLKDSGGATVSTGTSSAGFATRFLSFTGLTAASVYSFTFTCEGAQPDITPYAFVTLATPSGGNRTVSLSFGAPPALLVGAARVTVEYDDNEALSSPLTVQNVNCAVACEVELTIPAGLYWWRHIWQTAADVTLATGSAQPLQVH